MIDGYDDNFSTTDRTIYVKPASINPPNIYIKSKWLDEKKDQYANVFIDDKPLIRCKDCKYGHIDKWDGKYHCELNLHFEIVGKDLKGNTTYNCNSEWGADDFCSKGERRGEEEC